MGFFDGAAASSGICGTSSFFGGSFSSADLVLLGLLDDLLDLVEERSRRFLMFLVFNEAQMVVFFVLHRDISFRSF